MPLSHKYKYIFIHIPKTGGTSIRRFLGSTRSKEVLSKQEQRDYFRQQNIYYDYRHPTAYMYKTYELEPEQFETYFKFTFVRNPYDRCVSEFFYAKGGHTKRDVPPWLDQKVKNYFSSRAFSSFLIKYLCENNSYHSHTMSQSHFTLDENGNSLIDFIGRYENLREDFAKILDILKINKSINKLSHRYKNLIELDKSQYLTPKNKELIYNKFKKDFELFGYEK